MRRLAAHDHRLLASTSSCSEHHWAMLPVSRPRQLTGHQGCSISKATQTEEQGLASRKMKRGRISFDLDRRAEERHHSCNLAASIFCPVVSFFVSFFFADPFRVEFFAERFAGTFFFARRIAEPICCAGTFCAPFLGGRFVKPLLVGWTCCCTAVDPTFDAGAALTVGE